MTFDLNGLRIPKRPRTKTTTKTGSEIRPLAICPFTILVDTREQLPYDFSGMTTNDGELLAVPKRIIGLPSGDYSIEGMQSSVAVERKSLDDLYGSVTWGRRRFEHEIVRLDAMSEDSHSGFAAVVIEAHWREILDPREHRPGWINETNPRSVEGTIAAWSVRYPRVHWWACGDRRGAELRTFAILRAFWNEQQKQ